MNKTNIFSGIAMLLLAGIFFILLVIKPIQCNKPTQTIVRTIDTIYSRDSQPIINVHVYAPPGPINVQVPTVLPNNYQPRENLEELRKQYEDLAKSYTTIKTYKDSVVLKDSNGNRVGVFNNNDIVSENEIKTRQPSYQLTFPVKTITDIKTITQTTKPVNKLYIISELNGIATFPYVAGVNTGIMFQNKKDKIFYIKGGTSFTGKPQFGVGTAWKLRLRK